MSWQPALLAEWLAVVLGVTYVVLAARSSIWCWPAAFVSTAIFVWLFWQVALFLESLLNVYYLAMAVYGYWRWRQGSQSIAPVRRWPWSWHALLIVTSAVASYGLGAWMAANTTDALPFLDAYTTVFAVVTTVLVAHRVLENWWYWVGIDVAAAWMYLERGLTPTAGLFALSTVIAIWGYYQWRREWLAQTS